MSSLRYLYAPPDFKVPGWYETTLLTRSISFPPPVVPTMILPPLALVYLQKRRLVPQTGVWSRAADLGLIGASLFVFLPPAIATFPQTATIPASKVELAYQNIKDDTGNIVQTFEYNKGL